MLILSMVGISKTFVLLLLLLFLMSLVALPSSIVKAQSKTIVVPNDYQTIGEAVANANAGSIVFVKSGIYHENVTINKQLSLIGENSETTVIYGFRSYNIFAPDSTIQINVDDVLISQFTIRNCSIGINVKGNGVRLVSNNIDCFPTGIHLIGSNGTIANNTITSTQQGDLTVIGSNNIIQGNTITDGLLKLEGSFNSVDANSIQQITMEKATSNSISRNNSTHLFLFETCSYNNVFKNVFDGGGSGGYGVVTIFGSNNVFSENYFSNITYGVSIGHSFFEATGNRFYHNMFINNSRGYVRFNADLTWSDNYWDNGIIIQRGFYCDRHDRP